MADSNAGVACAASASVPPTAADLGVVAVGCDGLLGHLELHGLVAALLVDRGGDLGDGRGGGFGDKGDRLSFALGAVDRSLALAL